MSSSRPSMKTQARQARLDKVAEAAGDRRLDKTDIAEIAGVSVRTAEGYLQELADRPNIEKVPCVTNPIRVSIVRTDEGGSSK